MNFVLMICIYTYFVFYKFKDQWDIFFSFATFGIQEKHCHQSDVILIPNTSPTDKKCLPNPRSDNTVISIARLKLTYVNITDASFAVNLCDK